jgi:hypothetical protein
MKLSGIGGGVFYSASLSSASDGTCLGSINGYELTYETDVHEASEFSCSAAQATTKDHVAGLSGWSVNVDANLTNEDHRVSPGTKYRLFLRCGASGSSYLYYYGNAICAGYTQGQNLNEAGKRGYSFTGCGALTATVLGASAL